MVSAIVPLKLKSRRLPNKNFLMLGEKPLCHHIFNTLLDTPIIDRVFCYTSQPSLINVLPKEVDLLPRPHRLDGDDIKANELFRYAVEQLEDEVIVICQAPGPYVTSKSITSGIEGVVNRKYDCAFSTKRIQTYCWMDGSPLNYDPANMTQTQDLRPVYAETSGFYVFRRTDYLFSNSRINGTPLVIEVDEREAVDIDEPSDFAVAKLFADFDATDPDLFDQDPYLLNLTTRLDSRERITHVAFDLDGVIVDSINLMENAWNKATAEVGIECSFEYYKEFIGRPFVDILENLGIDDKYWGAIKKEYNKYSNDNIELVRLVPGITSTMLALKNLGVKISVVTSKPRNRARAVIERLLGSQLVDLLLSPEDVADSRGKPNPDQILLACINVGCDPSDTIYVGDMDVDRIAARRAGVHFVHAGWGYGGIDAVGEVWFNSVEDFSQFVIETLTLIRK